MISPSIPLAGYLQRLAAGEVSSRELVEEALAAIADPGGEGTRAFTRVYAEPARATADSIDRQRPAVVGPLQGIPVSVKDLFDVAGEPTPAGSVVLADAPPASIDSTVVARLREAGAVLVGRTNMTEFAFSGLGINPIMGRLVIRSTGRVAGFREALPRAVRFRWPMGWRWWRLARIRVVRSGFRRRCVV